MRRKKAPGGLSPSKGRGVGTPARKQKGIKVNLVDPASSHMLLSRTKPCMPKRKRVRETQRYAHTPKRCEGARCRFDMHTCNVCQREGGTITRVVFVLSEFTDSGSANGSLHQQSSLQWYGELLTKRGSNPSSIDRDTLPNWMANTCRTDFSCRPFTYAYDEGMESVASEQRRSALD